MLKYLTMIALTTLTIACNQGAQVIDNLPEEIRKQDFYGVITVDNRFNDEQKKEIESAVEQWAIWTNGMLMPEIQYGDVECNTPNTIKAVFEGEDCLNVGKLRVNEDDTTVRIVGFHSGNDAITIWAEGDRSVRYDALHEFGHFFGLDHYENGILTVSTDDDLRFTQEMAEDLCKKWACDANDLNVDK